MFPAMAILGAATSFAGGILQRNEITRATEERMRQMRIQAAQRVGQAEAVAGASGVEMTSSTVQNHLNKMRVEFDRAIQNVGAQGQAGADATIVSAMGGAAGSMFKGFSDYAQELDALGTDPFQGMPETSPGIKMPVFEWVP